MPESTETGILRIESEGGIRLAEVREYLAAVEDSYNGALLLLDTLDTISREGPLPWFFGPWIVGPLLGVSGPRKRGRAVVLSAESTSQLIAGRERLILTRVRLESPGFWESAGSLNPLEVIRQYLVDRHERRKDKGYREAAEDERLRLENELLRNRVIRERIGMARNLGVSEKQIAVLLNQLLYTPFGTLGRFQESGLITGVELTKTDKEH